MTRDEARIRLLEVQQEIESRFAKVIQKAELGGRGHPPGGGEWVEITNAISKECLSLSPEHAINEWLRGMNDYIAGRTTALYWRIDPDIDFYEMKVRQDSIDWDDKTIVLWKVYARIFVE